MKKLHTNIIVFCALLFSLSLGNLLNFNEASISELENRSLKAKPTFSVQRLFSGEYFKEVENYYSDHFAFHDRLLGVSQDIKQLAGFSRDGVSIQKHTGINIAENEEETTPVTATVDGNHTSSEVALQGPQSETPDKETNSIKAPDPVTSEDPVTKEKEPPTNEGKTSRLGTVIGGMLIANDRAMEIFSFDPGGSRTYARVINDLGQKLNNQIKIYSLLVPTQIEFLDLEKYKKVSDSQKSALAYTNENFSDKIIPVNAYEELAANKDKYLYFRTDHHWTALGAYYAYSAFCKAREEAPVPLERYEQGQVEGFLGSTYSATLNKNLKNHPDVITYYKPFVEHEYTVFYQGQLKMSVIDLKQASQKNKYRIFMSGDRPLGQITTSVANGNKLLVIKDSYGNAFIPFLIPHFQEIYIIDPRQFKSNVINFIQEKGIQEVLVLDYIPAAGNKSYTDLLAQMLQVS